MIPLGDVTPRRTRPVLTYAAAALLAAALVAFHASLDAAMRHAWLWRWGASADTLPWPALLSAPWLEPLWLAGAANLASLLLFGPAVEDRLGHVRYAGLLGIALVATLAMAALVPALAPRPAAGAAPVAAATMAAHVALFKETRVAWWVPGPGGGHVWEWPSTAVMAAWVLLVPGNLAQVVQAGPRATPPLLGVAVGIAVGASARWFARPERLAVDWWDLPPVR